VKANFKRIKVLINRPETKWSIHGQIENVYKAWEDRTR